MRQILCIALLIVLYSCKNESGPPLNPFTVADLNSANRELLEVAMEDNFPPPVASRVYVYPHIAHYIALSKFYPDSLPNISGKLNGLSSLGEIHTQKAHPELTALLAFCKTGKKVVFSENYMDEMAEKYIAKGKAGGLSDGVIQASDKCAEEISGHLAEWINKDNYIETRTMDRWTSTKEPGKWIETPPDYGAGLEPHWSKIRTMIIDSASAFNAVSPPPYDPAEGSDFYKMVEEVYNTSKGLDAEKKEIAVYWDDNPNVTEHRGHLVVMIHKISPPGHWLDIVSQVSRHDNSDLFKTTRAYTFSAIAMFDGIISSFYEKYHTDLVRPITYIQEHIDPNWLPLIQTPPFPEYTSAHSATSGAAATVLTEIYGDNYAFTDSTEVLFDQPVRSFSSFNDAAWEVSLSRFYGGIHYMLAISEGNRQGNFVGDKVLKKLQ